MSSNQTIEPMSILPEEPKEMVNTCDLISNNTSAQIQVSLWCTCSSRSPIWADTQRDTYTRTIDR
jgi:hypothetical protein